jgi:hypothetical protein
MSQYGIGAQFQGTPSSWPVHASVAPPAENKASPIPGAIALGVFGLAVPLLGLAAWNALQGVRLGHDSTLPTFIRAAIVAANTHRVTVFGVLAAVLVVAGLVLGVIGRRRLPGQLAMGLLGLHVVGLCGVAVEARRMPAASELRKLADAEREEAKAAAEAPAITAPAPKLSNRELGYKLGNFLGDTVLGRANGVATDVVQRHQQRVNALADALGAEVAPLPELTGNATTDRVAGLDYLLEGGGKALTQSIRASQGEDVAALVELGMKTSVARMLYTPKGSTNAAFVSVLDRTAKVARLQSPEIATTALKIKQSASRGEVSRALDAMDAAIVAELASPPADLPAPIGITTGLSTTPAAAVPGPKPAAAPVANKQGNMRNGSAQVNGSLPPEVIQRVMRTNTGRARLCYEQGLRSNPSLHGGVKVRFVIGTSGSVTSTSNSGSDMPDPSVVSCVIRSVSGIQFPAPSGGIVTVVYPYSFGTGS